MKDGPRKRFLLSAIAATQFPPFTWAYRAVYAWVLRVFVQRLRRIRGVRAAYLCRGLAEGGSAYGLCDIDVFVAMEGDWFGPAAAPATG